MADFDTYLGETEDGGYFALFDLTIPVTWESGSSSEAVLDTLGDVIAYAEDMRRAVHLLEHAGGFVNVSEEYEDALDVYFDTRAEAEAALRALQDRDLLDFLVENPGDFVDEDAEEGEAGDESGGRYGIPR